MNLIPAEIGQISTYETRLLQALRQEPNRVEYWVHKGRPDRNHKELIELYSKFFEILENNEIQYWLEYGSFLGYIRHHGIFPWEYDMDIGVTSEEFAKIQKIATLFE